MQRQGGRQSHVERNEVSSWAFQAHRCGWAAAAPPPGRVVASPTIPTRTRQSLGSWHCRRLPPHPPPPFAHPRPPLHHPGKKTPAGCVPRTWHSLLGRQNPTAPTLRDTSRRTQPSHPAHTHTHTHRHAPTRAAAGAPGRAHGPTTTTQRVSGVGLHRWGERRRRHRARLPRAPAAPDAGRAWRPKNRPAHTPPRQTAAPGGGPARGPPSLQSSSQKKTAAGVAQCTPPHPAPAHPIPCSLSLSPTLPLFAQHHHRAPHTCLLARHTPPPPPFYPSLLGPPATEKKKIERENVLRGTPSTYTVAE